VVIPIVRENIDRESHVMTDEAPVANRADIALQGVKGKRLTYETTTQS
jgi:hypothetical protein